MFKTVTVRKACEICAGSGRISEVDSPGILVSPYRAGQPAARLGISITRRLFELLTVLLFLATGLGALALELLRR